MKIAVFDNQQSGGGRRAIHELMRVLRSRGHLLHVYSYSTAAEAFLPLAPLAEGAHFFPLGARPVPDLRRVPYGPLLRAVMLDRRLDAVGRTTALAINAAGHDVAFVQECRYGVAPHLLRYLDVPSAFFCAEPKRGLYEHVSSNERPIDAGRRRPASGSPRALYHRSLRLLLHSYLRKVERENAASAGAIITCSGFSRELIWRAYGVFAWTSHLGVDVDKFRPRDAEREHAVASIGELVPRKAHDFVVEAIGAIPRERRPKLYLAANAAWDSERAYVERLAERLGVELQIHIDPGDEALAELYARVKLVAYPPIMEPFGLVALEAMASGTPVVGVAEGGPRESIVPGVTGLLVSRDVAEFSAAIDKVLNDGELARRLGDGGRERVLDYWTWEKACDRLEGNLARALGNPR